MALVHLVAIGWWPLAVVGLFLGVIGYREASRVSDFQGMGVSLLAALWCLYSLIALG